MCAADRESGSPSRRPRCSSDFHAVFTSISRSPPVPGNTYPVGVTSEVRQVFSTRTASSLSGTCRALPLLACAVTTVTIRRVRSTSCHRSPTILDELPRRRRPRLFGAPRLASPEGPQRSTPSRAQIWLELSVTGSISRSAAMSISIRLIRSGEIIRRPLANDVMRNGSPTGSPVSGSKRRAQIFRKAPRVER